MINEDKLDSFGLENNEEINLKYIFKKLKRNRYLILSITLLSSIFSIYFAKTQIPIYRGQFQILVEEEAKNKPNPSLSSLIPQAINSSRFTTVDTLKTTQALILKSPSVLNPVYEFAKSEYLKRGEDVSGLSYKLWVEEYLNFVFLDDSDVFQIDFEDKDKAFIMSTLNMISEKYKLYSKRDYNKALDNELSYLRSQETLYKKKYESSFKEYSDFVIENNLIARSRESNEESLIKFENISGDNLNPSLQPEITNRFNDQFSLLDQYELERDRYSAILKPNSDFMQDLDLRINKLKKATEKPTKIILNEQELYKKMIRDEYTLEEIKNRIILNQLTSAKQKDPWKLISIPTIDNERVYPKTINILFSAFFLSFFASVSLSLFKETLLGNIDDINLIKSKFKAKFINNIDKNNSEINVQILDLNIKNLMSENNKKSFKSFGIFSVKKNNLVSDYLRLNKEIPFIDFSNISEIKDIQNILILIESGKFTFNNIRILNKYIDLYTDKNFYWIYLEDE